MSTSSSSSSSGTTPSSWRTVIPLRSTVSPIQLLLVLTKARATPRRDAEADAGTGDSPADRQKVR
jgi:hypothetical protein